MKKTLCMLALLALLLAACAPVPPPDPPENPTEAPTENPSETPPDSQNPSNLPDSQPEAPAEPWQVDEATLTDDYLISLVIDMEIGLVGDNEFTFHDPTELSNDELYLCFLLLTDYKELEEHLRKGVWQGRETDLFYFTEDYITSRLSRFFKTFHFDITKCFNYAPDANAIVTPLASGFGGDREMKVTEKVLEGNTVTFTTTFHKWAEPDSPPYMTKTYAIEFYDGGYYYLSAVVDDPEEPWQVDEATLTDDYLISLVLDKESALNNGDFTFSNPEELTTSQLHLCFLLLTSHEECSQFLRKGVWQGMETDLFYIPEEFILTRLSEHFKQFHYDITQEGINYDPNTNCFVTPTVTGFGDGPDMRIFSKSIDGNIVTFTGGLYGFYHPEKGPYMTKTYTIEFYDGGYYYLSAIEVE